MQPALFIYIYSVAAVVLQGQHWVTAAEFRRATKPKLFTTWPFTEKVYWLLDWLMVPLCSLDWVVYQKFIFFRHSFSWILLTGFTWSLSLSVGLPLMSREQRKSQKSLTILIKDGVFMSPYVTYSFSQPASGYQSSRYEHLFSSIVHSVISAVNLKGSLGTDSASCMLFKGTET